MSFAKLDDLCRQLSALEHALAILGADEATNMAPGGGEARADAMASLSGIHHDKATRPDIADWLAAADREALSEQQQIALAEFARQYRNMTALPHHFVERQTAARIRCEQLWRIKRAENDWKGFEPALANIVALAREEAAMRGAALDLDPYDAMIEQYDPGLRATMIAPVFDELKRFLLDFLPKALTVQEKRRARLPTKPLTGTFPVEAQKQLGLAMMAALGFDFSRGSLSVSHHPFCGGVPTDVRMTTRYKTSEFLSALMGTMHETGHALYEQNLPQQWANWPSGKARGMAIHESQSLFVEKQIGRNPDFWRFAVPHLKRDLGVDLSVPDLLPYVHHLQRGLIRVDADEVTYPLHIMLRFDLERQLIAGTLEVADLPQAWDAGMQETLGLSTIDNPADGPMQDVHWPSGAFGYFPSYTLGAIMAAQQWATIERQFPDIGKDVAKGDFARVNDWRRTHIWQRASMADTATIMADATGSALDAGAFMAHLQRRYGEA
jgi:carboxypeptidase Taq